MLNVCVENYINRLRMLTKNEQDYSSVSIKRKDAHMSKISKTKTKYRKSAISVAKYI